MFGLNLRRYYSYFREIGAGWRSCLGLDWKRTDGIEVLEIVGGGDSVVRVGGFGYAWAIGVGATGGCTTVGLLFKFSAFELVYTESTVLT